MADTDVRNDNVERDSAISDKQSSDRKNWLLLALRKAKKGSLTPVQVQKILFLFSQEASAIVGDKMYTFEPYSYGPFCADIYEDLRRLAKQELISISPDQLARSRRYSITALGESAADAFQAKANDSGVQYLGRVVEWATSLPFIELLQQIYKRYPQFAVNSVFRSTTSAPTG